MNWRSHFFKLVKVFSWLTLQGRWTDDRVARCGLPHDEFCVQCVRWHEILCWCGSTAAPPDPMLLNWWASSCSHDPIVLLTAWWLWTHTIQEDALLWPHAGTLYPRTRVVWASFVYNNGSSYFKT